jgi:hypothetical protein
MDIRTDKNDNRDLLSYFLNKTTLLEHCDIKTLLKIRLVSRHHCRLLCSQTKRPVFRAIKLVTKKPADVRTLGSVSHEAVEFSVWVSPETGVDAEVETDAGTDRAVDLRLFLKPRVGRFDPVTMIYDLHSLPIQDELFGGKGGDNKRRLKDEKGKGKNEGDGDGGGKDEGIDGRNLDWQTIFLLLSNITTLRIYSPSRTGIKTLVTIRKGLDAAGFPENTNSDTIEWGRGSERIGVIGRQQQNLRRKGANRYGNRSRNVRKGLQAFEYTGTGTGMWVFAPQLAFIAPPAGMGIAEWPWWSGLRKLSIQLGNGGDSLVSRRAILALLNSCATSLTMLELAGRQGPRGTIFFADASVIPTSPATEKRSILGRRYSESARETKTGGKWQLLLFDEPGLHAESRAKFPRLVEVRLEWIKVFWNGDNGMKKWLDECAENVLTMWVRGVTLEEGDEGWKQLFADWGLEKLNKMRTENDELYLYKKDTPLEMFNKRNNA